MAKFAGEPPETRAGVPQAGANATLAAGPRGAGGRKLLLADNRKEVTNPKDWVYAVGQITSQSPSQVGTNWYSTCTGALVAPSLVLTAGHCVYGESAASRQFMRRAEAERGRGM